MMITRDEAIEVLVDLISSGVLAEDIEEKLQDICSCIEGEKIGRHEWGVSREKLSKLYSIVRADLVTEKDIEEYDSIHKKLTFIPSVDERILIQAEITERIEDATGEEVDGREIDKWFDRL